MKRIKTPEKHRRYQQKRARSERRKRRRHKQAIARRRRLQVGKSSIAGTSRRRKKGIVVRAPSIMSMVANATPTIQFVSTLNQLYKKRRRVFVEMQSVERIDHDAVVVLLSIMVRFRAAGVDFSGDFPSSQNARSVFVQSGFFEILYKQRIEWQEEYAFGEKNSSIYTHAKRFADGPVADEVIRKAASDIWGSPRRCQGVYRALLELMQNTNSHADPLRKGEKHWWLSIGRRKVPLRPHRYTVSFAFVDFGIGVFESLARKGPTDRWFGWQRALNFYSEEDRPLALRRILDGELHETVTGQYFRGKGLPGIRQVMTRNGMSRLVIITNNVYADVASDEYTLLDVHFEGTFVYWELTRYNESHPYDAEGKR